MTRTGKEATVQAVELAQEAEKLGMQGAYFRVHHFAKQQASPFPLLSAIAATTKTIEMGTGVIDMRYENPLYMAEEAAATDYIADGRLQLGISRGSPETALRGYEAFGYTAEDKERGSDMARAKTDRFLEAIEGKRIVDGDPKMTRPGTKLAIEPYSPGLRHRIWWGAGTRQTAEWAAEKGMNMMSSTLLTEDTGVPFDQLQAEQIQLFHEKFKEAGWGWTPQTSVSRSILPIVTDEDRYYFGGAGLREGNDQVGYIDGFLSRFGKTYVGEPDKIAEELATDEAVKAADLLMVTVPNQLGVEYNAHLLESITKYIAPNLGWTPTH